MVRALEVDVTTDRTMNRISSSVTLHIRMSRRPMKMLTPMSTPRVTTYHSFCRSGVAQAVLASSWSVARNSGGARFGRLKSTPTSLERMGTQSLPVKWPMASPGTPKK